MKGPISRMKSPPPGCSIFTTSAPISPSRPAQNGAAMRVPRSSTRNPSSGPLISTPACLLRTACAPRTPCGRRLRAPRGSLRLPWEAERALTDHVPLDLVRARPDRARLVVEPAALPRAVAGIVGRIAPQRRRLTEHRHRSVVHPLAHLRPPQLVDRPDRTRLATLGRARDGTLVVK